MLINYVLALEVLVFATAIIWWKKTINRAQNNERRQHLRTLVR